MQKVLLIVLLLPFVGCKKADLNNSIVTFNVNGISYNMNGNPNNWIQETYTVGTPTAYYFAFQGRSDIGFHVSQSNYYSTKGFISIDSTISDSLILNKIFMASSPTSADEFFLYGSPSISMNAWRFYITPTIISGGLMSGTFSGFVGGINLSTGGVIADSISNGVFSSVPLTRTFQ